MARTICLLTAALLLASTVSALPSLSPLPTDVLPAPALAEASADAAAVLEQEPLAPEVTAASSAVADVLSCRAVVQIDLEAWAYDVTDTRERDSAFLTPFVTGVREVVRMVPVTETRTETVWGPGGLLGFLQPVTRTVTEVVGYEPETFEVQDLTELHVSLAWAEDHLEVTPLQETVHVALPVGAPYLANGGGDLVTLCGSQERVLDHVPTIDCSGYDGCSMLPLSTGWYARLLDLDVRLAEAADQDLPMQDTRGWSIGGERLDDRIRMEMGALVPGQSEEAPAAGASADGTEAAGGGPVADAALHSTTSSLHVPTQTALFVAVAAFLIAGLATVGVVLLRMRR